MRIAWGKTKSLVDSHEEFLKHRYAIGWSSVKIARKLGLFTPAGNPDSRLVIRALRRLEIPIRRVGVKGRGYALRSWHAERIVAEHHGGMSAYALGKKYGVSRETMRRILLEEGEWSPRSPLSRMKYLSPVGIRLMVDGISLKRAAPLLGLTYGQIRKHAGNSGLPNARSKQFQAWRTRMAQEIGCDTRE